MSAREIVVACLVGLQGCAAAIPPETDINLALRNALEAQDPQDPVPCCVEVTRCSLDARGRPRGGYMEERNYICDIKNDAGWRTCSILVECVQQEAYSLRLTHKGRPSRKDVSIVTKGIQSLADTVVCSSGGGKSLLRVTATCAGGVGGEPPCSRVFYF